MPQFTAIKKSETRVLAQLRKINLSEEPYESVKFNDEPKLPTYVCIPNKEAKSKYAWRESFGLGCATNTTVAKIKSIAEFLERLSIFNPRVKSLIKSEYHGSAYVDPSLFLHYPDTQIKSGWHCRDRIRDGTYLWSGSVDYLNKKRVYLPAQLVYLSGIFKREQDIAPEQITTGAALGNGLEHAFESGFLEVVERDAFIISYLNKRRVPRIVDFPDSVNDILQYLKRYYIDVFVFDITTDLEIPAVMAIAVDKRGFGPAISVGLKSGFDIENVILGSVTESIQSRRQIRFDREMSGARAKLPTESRIRSIKDRYYYWYPQRMIGHLDFWLKGNTAIGFDKLWAHSSSLKESVKQLRDRGYHIFYTDITLGELKKTGFVAGKVLIPELQPLYLSERTKVLYSVHGGNIVPKRGLKPHPFT